MIEQIKTWLKIRRYKTNNGEGFKAYKVDGKVIIPRSEEGTVKSFMGDLRFYSKCAIYTFSNMSGYLGSHDRKKMVDSMTKKGRSSIYICLIDKITVILFTFAKARHWFNSNLSKEALDTKKRYGKHI